ncbi:hypothetical protein FQR65_LT20211 [Abscondita terminalis]|nr:hypothetical protein FQR65_LT20211 [Abscondita terminalis]
MVAYLCGKTGKLPTELSALATAMTNPLARSREHYKQHGVHHSTLLLTAVTTTMTPASPAASSLWTYTMRFRMWCGRHPAPGLPQKVRALARLLFEHCKTFIRWTLKPQWFPSPHPLLPAAKMPASGNNWTTDPPATSGFFSHNVAYRYNGSNPPRMPGFYTKAVNLTGGVSYIKNSPTAHGCGDAD